MAGVDDDAIEGEVAGTLGIVFLDKAAAAVAGGEMEDDFVAGDGLLGGQGVEQVDVAEFGAGGEILEASAGEIIGYGHAGSAQEEGFDEMGAYEGGASGDEDGAIVPDRIQFRRIARGGVGSKVTDSVWLTIRFCKSSECSRFRDF